jgi:hypothetical protein
MKMIVPAFNAFLVDLLSKFSFDAGAVEVLTAAGAADSVNQRENVLMMDYSIMLDVSAPMKSQTKIINFEPGYHFFLTSISARCANFSTFDGTPNFPLLGIQDAYSGKQFFSGPLNAGLPNEMVNAEPIQNGFGPGSELVGFAIDPPSIITEPKEYFYYFGERGAANITAWVNPRNPAGFVNRMNVILTGWKINMEGLK